MIKSLQVKDGLEVLLENEIDGRLDFVIKKFSDEIDKYENSLLWLISDEILAEGLSEYYQEKFKCKYIIYISAFEPIFSQVVQKWLPPSKPFAEVLSLGLKEMIGNAIVHGNKYDTSKNIFVTVNRYTDPEKFPTRNLGVTAQTPALLEIKIMDEGDGFDWKKTMDCLRAGLPIGKGKQHDSAGLGIVSCFNSGLYLTWNDKGNEAIAYLGYI